MGSVVLPHLRTAWHVDQAILSEEDRLVVCIFLICKGYMLTIFQVIRFGRDHDVDCMSASIPWPYLPAHSRVELNIKINSNTK